MLVHQKSHLLTHQDPSAAAAAMWERATNTTCPQRDHLHFLLPVLQTVLTSAAEKGNPFPKCQ